jgi:hypothetical protein
MAVGDNELLHRSFLPTDVNEEGKLSSTAFNDPQFRPSVDRALLRPNPKDTQRTPECGIAQLLTVEVRAVDSVARMDLPSGDAPEAYRVDVVERPVEPDHDLGIPANPAHAQIESDPELSNASRFKRLKEALSQLANSRDWPIQPKR